MRALCNLDCGMHFTLGKRLYHKQPRRAAEGVVPSDPGVSAQAQSGVTSILLLSIL